MSDLSIMRMLQQNSYREYWVERRNDPPKLTDEERLNWMGEYCAKYEYIKPSQTHRGFHEIIDDLNQRTAESSSLRDAIDAAAQKWKEANE